MSRILITICISLLLVSASYAGVIGNWEGMPTTGDGWIDWSSQKAIETLPNMYSANTSWYTLGSQSVQITKNGWAQTLSLKLEYQPGEVAEFLANTKIEFDVAVPNIGGDGGWGKIENVTVNASGWGWGALPSSTFMIGLWAGSGTVVKHEVVDYSSILPLITAVPGSGYIEIIFTTNNDSTNNEMLFDNVRLTPEPATMALLGLGGLALIRRKR
ncbi:MAG: PEP-CTERM sorting domain-containing protein [Sedimentisphaerales bacterium]|jgi:hypothetical protein